MTSILIKNYDPSYQKGIDQMMQEIQSEFEQAISGPQSVRIPDVYQLPQQRYWVALHHERVVGTIGAVIHTDYAEIKRMMVHPAFRGRVHNTALLLLEAAFDWVREHQLSQIYLGTMEQFKAAQRFYEKQGFCIVDPLTLPKDYHINPIDSLFYSLTLS